ncbi:MAG: glycosyltransferase [Bacteroidetes bacterium]|nr:glycosyltransferase [Bacteroidota bacterium]
MAKVRVMRIVNRFNLGGPTFNAAYLTRYLPPEFETLLIGGSIEPTEASSEFILKELGVDYHIIPTMHRSIDLLSDMASYREIDKIMKAYRPDIVHTHASKAGALGRMAAIRNKVPVIVHTYHGHVMDAYFPRVKTAVFTRIEQYLARHSTCIIALSQNQKTDLLSLLNISDPKKIEVIPLGFDLFKFTDKQDIKRNQFRSQFNLDEDTVAIGIVGRLVPVKNHTLFLKGIHHLQQQSQKKFHAFIIGDGEERGFLEKLASQMGILFNTTDVKQNNSILTFTSWIKEMDRVMAGLDIVVLTSLNEGTPVSLIEAQAAGKPVVSTRVGGIENVVIPGETALLSAMGDEKGFFNNLSELVDDQLLRKTMSEKGWEQVGQRFHYLRLVNDVSELYTRLLAVKNNN